MSDVSHNLVVIFSIDVTPGVSRLTTAVTTVKIARFVTSHSVTMVARRKNKEKWGWIVSDVTFRVPSSPFFRGVAREYYVGPSDEGHMDYFIRQLSVVTSCRFAYHINVAHSLTRSHTWSNGGRK